MNAGTGICARSRLGRDPGRHVRSYRTRDLSRQRPLEGLSQLGLQPLLSTRSALKGGSTRIVLGALREPGTPPNTRDITEIVMRECGLSRGDLNTRRTILRRGGACLNHWKRVKGMLGSSPGPGRMLNWEIVNQRC